MPLYNMVPKDKKSPRRPEVRRASVVIYVLPLLLCFLAAVTLWCYTVGQSRPAEPETTEAVTDTATPEENETAGEPHESDVPAESLPADGGAQPSDV